MKNFVAIPDSPAAPTSAHSHPRRQSAPPRTTHMAWFCHLIDAAELVQAEPDLVALTTTQLEGIVSRLGPMIGPVALPPTPLRIGPKQTVVLHPILIPLTSALLKQAFDSRQLETPRRLLSNALDLAVRKNCEVIALGQYTSILSHNGRFLARLRPDNLGLTTGNSYTVSLALQAVDRVLRQSGREPNELRLMVAGALGNIGSVCAEMLAPRFRKTLLLGSSKLGSMERLQTAAAQLPRSIPTTDPNRLIEADVVIAASSGVDALLHAGNLAPNAIVCDISVPAAVHQDVARLRPDVTVIRGGLAQLPGGENLNIQNFPLAPGQVFGCMAEGILLAASGVRNDHFTGTITPEHLRDVDRMAAQHAFELADTHQNHLFGA